VRIIVPSCIAAVADAVIRKKATDIPSEVSINLFPLKVLNLLLLTQVSLNIMGYGKRHGYGLSTGKFGDQSETIEVHTAELNIARTAVLDYFTDQRDTVPQSNQIFCWEEGMTPEASTNRLLAEICEQLGTRSCSGNIRQILISFDSLPAK